MKKWNNPELKELGLANTKEDICYCEEGEVATYGYHGCGGNHGGHPHRPNRPGGKPCPEKPQKPNRPSCNIPACPGFGPIGSVTPDLSAPTLS